MIALLTLLIQGVFSIVGFLVGLACVGLYLGYTRAWALVLPGEQVRVVEDEDD